MDLDRWLAGGPSPEGEGRVPNITPHEDGLAKWSSKDIAYYLQTGFTPDFDTVGGTMVKVQENFSRLPPADLQAVAAYLKAIPAREQSR
jgi:mono/diheme cytochrome c family protein